MKLKTLKHLIILIIFIGMTMTTKAQTNIDSANWQLRALFTNLAKPTPPRLFNWDMAVHMVDSSIFIPINYNDTLDTENFADIYSEMRNSAFDTLPILTIDSVLSPTNYYGPDTINIMTMFYDYYRFKDDALTTNIYFDFDTINNILTDKAIRPGYPYDIFKMFASAPNKNLASGNQVIYRFGLENLFYDNFNMLDANAYASGIRLRANFNEGTGWHDIILGQENFVPIYYTNAGKYAIEMQVIQIVGENETELAHSISYTKIKKTRGENYEFPSQVLNMFEMNINVYDPCGDYNPKFEKTLIYLEGIDVLDFYPNGGKSADYIYKEQIEDTKLADLRNFGYRIFVVDWQNSRQDMRKNAKNLNDFIEYLKCGNINNYENQEEFVIIGESMGGIIANYALLQQENGQYTSNCKPEKMHNTRLLMTLDSPFEGANIPMGIQKMVEFIKVNTGVGLGLDHFFNKHDLLAEGVAAKQLLMYHIKTQSTLPPYTYYPHSERNDFITDQDNMGKHPRYCKLIAASNGNMMGKEQNNYWNGQPRIAGDKILHLTHEYYGSIKGFKFPFLWHNLEVNTDPNGIGQIGSINIKTWTIKIKLKKWGLKITLVPSVVKGLAWKADMLPVSTSSGGVYDFNYYVDNSLFPPTEYIGNGEWKTFGTNKWGKNKSTKTDGVHWCFVPNSSAFDGGVILNNPYDILNMNNVLNAHDFHILYGVKGTQQKTIKTIPFQFGQNVYISNNYHTDMRNDSLQDFATLPPPHFVTYPGVCSTANGSFIRKIYMLNREFGDNKIQLENRIQPWKATCSMSEGIDVNIKSEFYNYPNTSPNGNQLESVYSKEEPYIIDPNSGYNELTTTTGNVNYQPPMSGPYNSPIVAFWNTPCCKDFYKQSNTVNVVPNNPKNEIIIYPNPTSKNFIMTFTPNQIGEFNYTITDLLGNIVYKNKAEIKVKNIPFNISVQLPFTLPLGQYIIHANFADQFFSNKLIIQ